MSNEFLNDNVEDTVLEKFTGFEANDRLRVLCAIKRGYVSQQYGGTFSWSHLSCENPDVICLQEVPPKNTRGD